MIGMTSNTFLNDKMLRFDLCERWIGVDNNRYSIATYDLDSVKVLQGAEYKNIAYQNLSPWSKRVTGMCDRILRFEGTQIFPGNQVASTKANAILMVAINVDELGAGFQLLVR